MLKEVYILIILLLAVPIGYLISVLCHDELIIGRKWFKIIAIISIVLSLILALFRLNVESITLLFISIVSFVSYLLSFNKKIAKK